MERPGLDGGELVIVAAAGLVAGLASVVWTGAWLAATATGDELQASGDRHH